MPLDVLDASHDSFQAKVLPELSRRGIAVLGMKPLGDGWVLEFEAYKSSHEFDSTHKHPEWMG